MRRSVLGPTDEGTTDAGLGAQTSIMQNLSYFEHLSEPMAEFLQILAEQYDYPQLTDEILRYERISDLAPSKEC